jgi:hypothetical protein
MLDVLREDEVEVRLAVSARDGGDVRATEFVDVRVEVVNHLGESGVSADSVVSILILGRHLTNCLMKLLSRTKPIPRLCSGLIVPFCRRVVLPLTNQNNPSSPGSASNPSLRTRGPPPPPTQGETSRSSRATSSLTVYSRRPSRLSRRAQLHRTSWAQCSSLKGNSRLERWWMICSRRTRTWRVRGWGRCTSRHYSMFT